MTSVEGTPKGNKRDSGYERAAGDWYQEEIGASLALLRYPGLKFEGPVWDPACGGGNIPEACKRCGLRFAASDLIDRGYPGMIVHDFLYSTVPFWRKNYEIVTNPPYDQTIEFALRGLSMEPRIVALFIETMHLQGRARFDRLFSIHRPALILQFINRVNTPPGGLDIKLEGAFKRHCWVVWTPQESPAITEFDWIEKPDIDGM